MRIIEIAALSNGAHRNQNGGLSVVPDGWAVICEREELENFPFGSFDVEYIAGVPYMKKNSWIPGVIPEPEPVPESEPTQLDILEAQVTYTAMMTDTLLGV